MANQYTKGDPKVRFERLYEPCPTTGCWLWLGAGGGYGQFFFEGKHIGAHRAAYLLFRGEIPAHLEIDHVCNTPLCVNPDHLRLLTPRENVMRGNGLAARNARQTQCKRGHALPPHIPGEQRICAECLQRPRPRPEQREYMRDKRRKERAAFYALGLSSRGTPRVYNAPKTRST